MVLFSDQLWDRQDIILVKPVRHQIQETRADKPRDNRRRDDGESAVIYVSSKSQDCRRGDPGSDECKKQAFFVIFSLTDKKLGERIAFRKGELSDDEEHNGIDHKIDQLDQYLVHSALPVYSVP